MVLRLRDLRRLGVGGASSSAAAGGAACCGCTGAGASGGFSSGGMDTPASSPVAAPKSSSAVTLSCLLTANLSAVYVMKCVGLDNGWSRAALVTAPHASSSSVSTVSVPIRVM